MSGRPAVFLDRDGTLIEERGYPVRVQDIVLLKGVGPALRRLEEAGFLCLLLTNQSAVARGLLDEEGLERLHAALAQGLSASNARLHGIYYCPHHPDGIAQAYRHACRCRKPAPGLLELACAEHQVDLRRSVCIGDSPRDLFPTVTDLGARVLVRSGHALPPPQAGDAVPDHIAADLPAAVDWWLAQPLPT